MFRATPAPRVRQRLRAAAISTLLLALSPTPATAEPYPVPQHVNFGADWTEGLRPEDLSPSRAVTCIVDSGTAITPDTPPDNPDGPVVLRTSVDAAIPFTPPTDGDAIAEHGTYMAAAAVAPRNFWGTVGLEPLGRVATVRALAEGSRTFSIEDVQRGVARCLGLTRDIPRITAISLSLAKVEASTEQEQAQFAETVSRARRLGIAVVAAAGDEASASTGWPAAAPGVIAVTATGPDGNLCAYAPRDERVDIAGPGCGVLEAADLGTGRSVIDDAAGSSTAAAWMAQAITLLCDLSPALNGSDASQLILDTARTDRQVPTLNLAAAAEAAGGAKTVLLARGRLSPSSGDQTNLPAGGAPGRLPETLERAKRLSVVSAIASWRSRVLTVRARGREAGGFMRVSLYRGERSNRRNSGSRSVRSSRVAIRLKRRPTYVGIRMLPAARSSSRASRFALVRVTSHGTGRG